MKRIYIIFLIGTLCLSFFSCDKALDINKDPLAATSANPNAVLPFILAEYTARKTSELGTRTIDVIHHFGATFNSPRNGNISVFLTGNVWNTWYTSLLGNLALLEQDALVAGETSNNIQAVAKIMRAHLFFETTSMWGSVPFTEASDGETFPTPQFDSQEEILDGIVAMLDEAMSLIDAMPSEGNFNFTQGDLLLGGDIKRWGALANSIKIRVLMLIRNVSNREADAETKLVAAFKEPTISTPVFLSYAGGSGADNAYFGLINQFFGPSNEAIAVYGPSPTLVNQLQGTGDPRLDLWLVDTGSTFDVAKYGDFPSLGKEVVFADVVIRGDYPDVYFLPGELSFYEAELLLDGVAVSTRTAQVAFEEGATSTVNYWGGDIEGFQGTPVSDAGIKSFVANLGPVTLNKIHMQLWLESFLRPIVAWNTVRRTGTPALKPSGSATIKTILKRFDYPPAESAANPNTPANTPTDTPMWFENL